MAVACPQCGAPMVVKTTTKFSYPNGEPRKFYGCSRYPRCHATHGAHPNGEPLGVPADAETKAKRILVHDLFDRFWKPELGGSMSRKDAYLQLQRVMGMSRGECHIGMWDAATCDEAILRLQGRT